MSIKVTSLIDDPIYQKFISVTSLWEIAIKSNIGKLNSMTVL